VARGTAGVRIVDEGALAVRLGSFGDAVPRVIAPGNFGTPWQLLSIVDREIGNYRLFALNSQEGWPSHDGVINETPFVGPGVRHDVGLDYLPMRLSLVPRLFETLRPPDIVLLHTSVPRGGKVSMGIEVDILPAAVEAVRRRGGLVIAQLNPQMPYTEGDGELEVDDLDLGFEVDAALPSPPRRPVDAAAELIGRRVAEFVVDGGTIQLGIGELPGAAARALHGARRLGVWSEMVSDGIADLDRAGALDPSRPIHASFLFGTPELYQWAAECPRLVMRRTEVINDPSRVAAQPAMLSVNTALEIDLFAQANACSIAGHVYSGFGGQPDFVVGALHSRGGHAVIALRAWHDRSDRSTIVPLVQTPVSSFQHSVVVTDVGKAEIFGRSQRGQARVLIEETADPRARPSLWEAASRLGLVAARRPAGVERPTS
jgi:acyl-CoA hydrolase